MLRTLTIASLLAGCLAACTATIKPDFDSPEPAARNAAIVNAAAAKDKGAVPDLVRMLDSDDPATRLLAIVTLQRLTGQTLGYDYAASDWEREGAMQRWVQWVDSTRSDGGRSAPPGTHLHE